METTDLGSVLGIASGVSASVVMVCIAIGLTARFRHHHGHGQQQQQQQQRLANNNGATHHGAGDHQRRGTMSTSNGADAKAPFTQVAANVDEPDVILNNSGGGGGGDPNWPNHHSPANQVDINNQWNGTLNKRRVEVDVVPIVPNPQFYSQPSASGSPIRHQMTWSTLERSGYPALLHNNYPPLSAPQQQQQQQHVHQVPAGTVEVVTVKTPHRSAREVPETSI